VIPAIPAARTRERGLRANATWLLIGHVAYALGYWTQFVILARVGGPDAVGAYAYALALTAPPFGLASLGLRALLASDARDAHGFREYRALRAASIAVAALATLGFASTTAGAAALAVLVPVCVLRAAESLADIYYGWWQRHERMAVIGLCLVASGAGSAAFMAAAAAVGEGVAGAAWGAALGPCCALVLVHVRTRAAGGLRADGARHARPTREAWRRLARLAAEGAPLGVITLLDALQTNVPRYFIRLAAGEAALGLYAAAGQLPAVGGVVTAALGSAAVPRLAALRSAGDVSGFRSLTRTMLLVGAALGAGGVALSALLGKPLLVVLYRAEFAAAYGLLVVLSVAAGVGFLASLYGYALTAARIIAVQPVITVAGIAALALLCATIVPRFGSIGAAWAVVGATAVLVIARAAALRLSRGVGPRAEVGPSAVGRT
jgi:O-antigen/teichoic acid export membrane protein